MKRKGKLLFALAALIGAAGGAQAQDIPVKIGVLTDMSSLYSSITGAGSVAAAKLAVDDFNPAVHHMKVEVVSLSLIHISEPTRP